MERHASAAAEVRFCRASDGVRIAYAVHGSGPPLLVNKSWISNLQYDGYSPLWRHFIEGLGRIATVITYDERAYGLSDRDVSDFSLEARVGDLETVADAAGVDRFALMGMSQGGPVVITYALRHPERVTRLFLYGAHATPTRGEDDEQLFATFVQLIQGGWSRPESTFRRAFTESLIPAATAEQKAWIDESLSKCCSVETAVRAAEARRRIDVTDLLANLAVSTLVLHTLGDRMNDFEEGRLLASHIPDARLVALDSENHLLMAEEPAWQVFLSEAEAFLRPDRELTVATMAPVEALTAREVEVLHLAAEGLPNDEIAERLTISIRTAERHLSNAYRKLGVSGRSARAAAVAHILSR